MNYWDLSGTILATGIKGTQYPKLWIKLELEPVTFFTGSVKRSIDRNQVFINYSLDPNSQSKAGQRDNFFKSNLAKDKFLLATNCTMGPIKRSRKTESGEFENYFETGLTAKVGNSTIYETRVDTINYGMVMGEVSSQNSEKIIVAERYKVPDGTWKHRDVPLYIPSLTTNILGKKIYVIANCCGTTPSNESKVFGLVKTWFEV